MTYEENEKLPPERTGENRFIFALDKFYGVCYHIILPHSQCRKETHEQKQSIHKISEESAYQPQETYHRRGKYLVLQIRGTAQQGEDTLLLPDVQGQVLRLQTGEGYTQNGFDELFDESGVNQPINMTKRPFSAITPEQQTSIFIALLPIGAMISGQGGNEHDLY